MASEEWAKRFLRLAGYWPKDTREPRGPEHMAKMKAARGPYSDPRDTYIMREIRWAFESSNGRPLSTGYLLKRFLAGSCASMVSRRRVIITRAFAGHSER